MFPNSPPQCLEFSTPSPHLSIDFQLQTSRIQVSKIMNPETIKYLQQDEIGKVIAKGLANLYTHKPQTPVKYLAEWLRTYSRNRAELSAVVKAQENKSVSVKALGETQKLAEIQKESQDKKLKEIADTIDRFKKEVVDHEYQAEMLEEVFPEFIEKHTAITGAYVGYLNYPPRAVTEEDTDELAHLNTAAEKLINYIGSSLSHKSLMRGKTLSLSEGVTGRAFSLGEEQAPVVGEDGQQIPQAPKQQYIYVPNVVKNEKMHYFKIPKLGSYLAVPLVYRSFLSEKLFDVALEAKNKHLEELEEFNTKKSEEIEQINTQKQQLEKKIHDLKEKNAEDPNLQALNTELEALNSQIKAKQEEGIQEPDLDLPLEQESYVFCVDNLGRDCEFPKQDIDIINQLVSHFKQSIEEKERRLLFKDVNTHVDLIKSLGKAPQVIKEELQKQLELDEEATKEINELENEGLKAYKLQELEFNKLKSAIENNPVYLASFLKLKQFRVVKYKDVIQSLLFFHGFSKSEVNTPKTACLNWKDVKCKFITEVVFKGIIDYIVQGPKTGEFKFYSKTPFLTEVFDKFNEEEIFEYNVGLGALVKFVKVALKHRSSNVELRKEQKKEERKNREDIIANNEKLEQEKAAELEKVKAALAPEDVEAFNPEEWAENYDKEHPLAEVPAEVVDDVDNDM